MHILAQLPPDFWPIVVIILGGVFVWVLVMFMISTIPGGWGSFAKHYPARTRPAGNAYSVLRSSFGRCVRVIFTDTGIYFYMTFLGRAGHPPFLLPWKSVKRIEMGQGAGGNFYMLEIEDAIGELRLDLPEKIEQDLSRYYTEKNHEAKTTPLEPFDAFSMPGDKAAGTFAVCLGVVGVLGSIFSALFSILPLSRNLSGLVFGLIALQFGIGQLRTARKKKQQESDVSKKKDNHDDA